jgi:hypothetical protein
MATHDDASPLVPLATKLFVSPGQLFERGVITDATPGDPFARRIISAAEKQSLYDLAKIASDRYRRPISEVWSEILNAIAEESFASADFRSGGLVLFQINPMLFCWTCSKIISLHLDGLPPANEDEDALEKTSIRMASRGVRLVGDWAIGQASSSKLLGESPTIEEHLAREISRLTIRLQSPVYLPADVSWAAAARGLMSVASVLAEGVPVSIDDFVTMAVVRSMVMAMMAEDDLPPTPGSRKIASSLLAEELSSNIVKFPMPSQSYRGAGSLVGDGFGAAAIGVVAGAAATFFVRRGR